jgi:hypothetical protein
MVASRSTCQAVTVGDSWLWLTLVIALCVRGLNSVAFNSSEMCCDGLYCGIQQHNRRTHCLFVWDRRVNAIKCMAKSRLLEIQFNIILLSIPNSFISDFLLPSGLSTYTIYETLIFMIPATCCTNLCPIWQIQQYLYRFSHAMAVHGVFCSTPLLLNPTLFHTTKFPSTHRSILTGNIIVLCSLEVTLWQQGRRF